MKLIFAIKSNLVNFKRRELIRRGWINDFKEDKFYPSDENLNNRELEFFGNYSRAEKIFLFYSDSDITGEPDLRKLKKLNSYNIFKDINENYKLEDSDFFTIVDENVWLNAKHYKEIFTREIFGNDLISRFYKNDDVFFDELFDLDMFIISGRAVKQYISKLSEPTSDVLDNIDIAMTIGSDFKKGYLSYEYLELNSVIESYSQIRDFLVIKVQNDSDMDFLNEFVSLFDSEQKSMTCENMISFVNGKMEVDKIVLVGGYHMVNLNKKQIVSIVRQNRFHIVDCDHNETFRYIKKYECYINDDYSKLITVNSEERNHSVYVFNHGDKKALTESDFCKRIKKHVSKDETIEGNILHCSENNLIVDWQYFGIQFYSKRNGYYVEREVPILKNNNKIVIPKDRNFVTFIIRDNGDKIFSESDLLSFLSFKESGFKVVIDIITDKNLDKAFECINSFETSFGKTFNYEFLKNFVSEVNFVTPDTPDIKVRTMKALSLKRGIVVEQHTFCFETTQKFPKKLFASKSFQYVEDDQAISALYGALEKMAIENSDEFTIEKTRDEIVEKFGISKTTIDADIDYCFENFENIYSEMFEFPMTDFLRRATEDRIIRFNSKIFENTKTYDDLIDNRNNSLMSYYFRSLLNNIVKK